jgi:hypothetical protein
MGIHVYGVPTQRQAQQSTVRRLPPAFDFVFRGQIVCLISLLKDKGVAYRVQVAEGLGAGIEVGGQVDREVIGTAR